MKKSNILIRVFRRILGFFLGNNTRKKLIQFLAWDMDLIKHVAHPNMGIGNYETDELSGEAYVINTVLKEKFADQKNLVFFDAGANVGRYSENLYQAFPEAQIYAFEPHPKTFEQLQQRLSNGPNIHLFNLGLSNEAGESTLISMGEEGTSHDSIHVGVGEQEILSGIIDSYRRVSIQLSTLDLFCDTYQVQNIDFLKIDTEGNELNILFGAKYLLENQKIKIIQFEFNSMNIYSRVFLRDFYELLHDFKIFRLDSNNLIPLFVYDNNNEIFRFQNFLAIHQSIA